MVHAQVRTSKANSNNLVILLEICKIPEDGKGGEEENKAEKLCGASMLALCR